MDDINHQSDISFVSVQALFIHEKIFCADLDFLFLLLDTQIAHKDILSLHESTSCVYLDVLLLLLDADIDHKNSLPLHEPTFYAFLDYF